jgi:hypothetical protein
MSFSYATVFLAAPDAQKAPRRAVCECRAIHSFTQSFSQSVSHGTHRLRCVWSHHELRTQQEDPANTSVRLCLWGEAGSQQAKVCNLCSVVTRTLKEAGGRKQEWRVWCWQELTLYFIVQEGFSEETALE